MNWAAQFLVIDGDTQALASGVKGGINPNARRQKTSNDNQGANKYNQIALLVSQQPGYFSCA